ncbi:HPr kinase/phosphorylase [Rhizobiales bacterium RZME27]|jgi:serine kinase of HPr protein (carbohydrate metabolism regulator)|uniref:HPr kinase/phosphorylase n=1 Tax=Endobacterium cereale TaxID=2663029 RepID=A0A6A8A3R7_9HYPH|nr:HPr kinase/phosphatase C-terminal domain-containing protein [Endobacterium cereale]MEB2845265.1 HPr kinase/phosphatase C-terminal domain-containing protein [Endobacterium cereale]MQY45224.1 HPr kinase/phosphorylase [Endobacterium cereale]
MSIVTKSTNLHGTAIVIGTSGFLFVAPSGVGKSSLALDCLQAAQQAGQYCALIADDQVFIDVANGQVIARRPSATAGLIEIRHTGIARTDSIEAAVLHLVIQVVERQKADRLPPDEETYALPTGHHLPLLRIARDTTSPLKIIDYMKPYLNR